MDLLDGTALEVPQVVDQMDQADFREPSALLFFDLMFLEASLL